VEEDGVKTTVGNTNVNQTFTQIGQEMPDFLLPPPTSIHTLAPLGARPLIYKTAAEWKMLKSGQTSMRTISVVGRSICALFRMFLIHLQLADLFSSFLSV
jgi:hypothetical protein